MAHLATDPAILIIHNQRIAMDIDEVIGNIQLSTDDVLVVVVPHEGDIERCFDEVWGQCPTHAIHGWSFEAHLPEGTDKTVHFLTHDQYERGVHVEILPDGSEPLIID